MEQINKKCKYCIKHIIPISFISILYISIFFLFYCTVFTNDIKVKFTENNTATIIMEKR